MIEIGPNLFIVIVMALPIALSALVIWLIGKGGAP